jgi:hypothetical protein
MVCAGENDEIRRKRVMENLNFMIEVSFSNIKNPQLYIQLEISIK